MNIFSPDYPDHFSLFGASHIATMIIIAVFWIFVPVYFRKGISDETDKRLRYAMAAVLVGQYLGWMLWEAVTGRFTLALSLPLNLCDMTNFLLAVLLVRPGRRLFEVLYFWALAGTIQSYITPNITFNFPHFEFLVFYLQHGGEILVILYFVFVLKYRPHPMSIVKTYAWLMGLIAFVYIFNLITDSNYMFLMADTPHPSTVTKMIGLFGEPPRHMIGLALVALVSILILYVPWVIVDLKNKRGSESAPPQ
jgi:hypothetical integral membrane protein (TIGR02206 family)